MMLSCKEASRLASEGLDGKLSLAKRLALRMHLLLCAACRAYGRQVRAIEGLARRRFGSDAGQDAIPGPRLSEEARGRIQKALGKGDKGK